MKRQVRNWCREGDSKQRLMEFIISFLYSVLVSGLNCDLLSDVWLKKKRPAFDDMD